MAGEWKGRLKDSSGEFEYKLKLGDEKSGAYTGVSTSRSADFYCETKVKAVEKDGRLIVSEIEVLNTNFPNKQALCLLKLNLIIAGSKLSGDFVPLSNTADCLSGNISLSKVSSPRGSGQVLTSRQPVRGAPSSSLALKNNTAGISPRTTATIFMRDSLTTQKTVVPRVESRLRLIELDEDEAELIILDNKAVDGDIITLIDNGRVIFRKVTLTKIPLSYKINNIGSSGHLIKLYAENLGSTPPNTGLLIVKTRKEVIKTDFVSDLTQTATIQINLKKAL
ncbi:MAG: hypothetical protein V4721_03210 [Bacteroidota bacterium]